MLVESLKVLLTADGSGLEKEAKKAERYLKKLERDMMDVAQAAAASGAAIIAFGTAMAINATKFDASVKAGVEGAKNAFNVLSVEIARALLPAIHAIEKAITLVVNAWRSLAPETRRFIVVAAELAAVLATVVASGVGLQAAFLKLAPVLLPVLTPLLTIVGVLVAIIAASGLLRTAWDENWGGMRDTVSKFLDMLQSKWTDTFGSVVKIAKALADALIRNALEPIYKILDGLAQIARMLGQSSLANMLEAARDTVGDTLKGGLDQVAKDFTKSIGVAVSAGQKIGKAIASGVEKNVDDIISKIFGRVGQLPKMKELDDKPIPYDWDQIDERSAEITAERLKRRMETTDAARSSALNGPLLTGMRPGRIGQMSAAGPQTSRTIEDIEKAQEARAQMVETMSDIGRSLASAGSMLVSKLGNFGTVVQAAIQGAQSGGIWGALIAMVAAIVSMAPMFERLRALADSVLFRTIEQLADGFSSLEQLIGGDLAGTMRLLTGAVKILNPIFKLFAKLMESNSVTFWLIGKLFETLGAVLEVIVNVLMSVLNTIGDTILGRLLFDIAKIVLLGIMHSAEAILTLWNGAVTAIEGIVNDVVSFLTAGVDTTAGTRLLGGLRSPEDTMTSLQHSITELENSTYDGVRAQLQLEAAGQGAADALDRFSESLTNVPSGFRVAAARYQATAAGAGGGSLSYDWGSAGGKGLGTTVVNVYVDSKEVAAATSEAQEDMEKKEYGGTSGRWGPR